MSRSFRIVSDVEDSTGRKKFQKRRIRKIPSQLPEALRSAPVIDSRFLVGSKPIEAHKITAEYFFFPRLTCAADTGFLVE